MSIKLIGLKPQSNFRELSDRCIFQDYTYILASRYSIWNAICFAKCDTILVKSSLFLSNFSSEPKQDIFCISCGVDHDQVQLLLVNSRVHLGGDHTLLTTGSQDRHLDSRQMYKTCWEQVLQ